METERDIERDGRQSPFKRELSKYTQVVLFVATAEDILYPKDRPVRMPKY